MKKIYYLAKTIITLPCLGLAPLGGYAVYSALAGDDYGTAAFWAVAIMFYIWMVWNYVSPAVNPAFIKSAASPGVFIGVNAVITVIITLVIFTSGACLWPLLCPLFEWLGDSCLELHAGENTRLLWLYALSNVAFLLVYLGVWGYLQEHRLVRRLTLPNICW